MSLAAQAHDFRKECTGQAWSDRARCQSVKLAIQCAGGFVKRVSGRIAVAIFKHDRRRLAVHAPMRTCFERTRFPSSIQPIIGHRRRDERE